MPATTQTPKMPWFLRIQEALNLQSLARTVGLGFLYGAVLAAFVAPPDDQTQLLVHLFWSWRVQEGQEKIDLPFNMAQC